MQTVVALVDSTQCHILRISDLSRLEANGNYSRVYWNDSSMLIRRPLGDCEKRFGRSFFRTSRFAIVNLEHVEHVRHTRIQNLIRYVFILRDGTEVTLSRKQTLLLRRTRSL